MTEANDLKNIVALATEAYSGLLTSYTNAAGLLIDKATGADWSPDDTTTAAVVTAIETTASAAGTAIGLSRQWLQTATELDSL